MKKLLILAGPSAVGKTTVAKKILSIADAFEYSRSATTRAPRGDEHDAEYVYLTKEDFRKTAEQGDMLEYTEFTENLYGTPREEIERIFASGRTPLLVLDLNGVDSLKLCRDYESFAVYLYDDPDVLEERLYARYLANAPSVEGLDSFQRRKERNLYEFANIEKIKEPFDLLIRNSELDKTAREILSAYSCGASPDNTAAVSEILAFVEERKNRKPMR